MSQREPTPEELRDAVRGRRRREPRYVAFLVTGAVVGVVAAALLTFLGEPGQQYTQASLFGYLATILGVLGGLAAGAVAVLLARRD